MINDISQIESQQNREFHMNKKSRKRSFYTFSKDSSVFLVKNAFKSLHTMSFEDLCSVRKLSLEVGLLLSKEELKSLFVEIVRANNVTNDLKRKSVLADIADNLTNINVAPISSLVSNLIQVV